MILLFGLKGYTGLEIAPEETVQRQELLWQCEHTPREEDKSDLQRLKEAAEHDRGLR